MRYTRINEQAAKQSTKASSITTIVTKIQSIEKLQRARQMTVGTCSAYVVRPMFIETKDRLTEELHLELGIDIVWISQGNMVEGA